MTLWDVATGEKAVIAGYDKTIENSLRDRLSDLGFSPGTSVLCLRHTPFSGPRVYEISGSVFALEKPLAIQVVVGGVGKSES